MENSMDDEVSVYGEKPNGERVFLGTTLVSPKMKAKILAVEQFGMFEEGDGSDTDLCHYALGLLIEHCEKWHTEKHFKPAQA